MKKECILAAGPGPGLEAAAGHLGGLPGDVAEELLDGGEQGQFFCERIC